MTAAQGYIGLSLPRVEDARMLQGRALFVADVDVADCAHAVIVRSPYAHAALRSVDLEVARAMPGVIDAFCGLDVVEVLRPFPSNRPIASEWLSLLQLPLAVDTVRYVGEPIAVVVAGNRSLAEDAAATVILDAVELPVVGSARAGGPELFPGHSNVVAVVDKKGGLPIDQAVGQADEVVEETFRVQRHSGVPLETRGLVARPDPDGGITLWGVAKMPHFVRSAVADMLHLAEESVRVQPVNIGGGFGVRGELYPEDFLVPFAAIRAGLPVRWIEDRGEHLVGTNHARETDWRVRAGATRAGELIFIQADAVIDVGAYVRPLMGVVAEQCALNMLGPYRTRSFSCRVECALSNKMGIGTMRAPGRYEATFAREGIIDLLAAKVGIDPSAFRDRNLLGARDYPYDTGVESFGRDLVYDSGDPRTAFGIAVKAIRARRSDLEREPSVEGRLIGTGVVPFIESTGLGPFEQARISIEEPGKVVVRLGTTSMGQGHETSFAQIAADAVGVEIDDVVVLEGDPSSVSAGVGTFASRSLVMGGNAIFLAGTELGFRRDKLDPDHRLPLGELLELSGASGPELDVEARFETWSTTYAYGAHAAIVAIDPALGSIEVLHYVVVADVGLVVNPAIVHGQVQGGVVQGLGGALLEELIYSDDGQPLATTLMDYLLPSAHETPDIEVSLIDIARSPGNPLGVKGAGEIGTIAVGAAVAAAARDALHGLGVRVNQLPLKPDRLVIWREPA
jgi:carbon-monoxide dehydrogenase large subunit